MSLETKVARPRERYGAGSTSDAQRTPSLQLAKQVRELEADNKRLRHMLAAQRKLWSVRLLERLDRDTTHQILQSLGQDLCCGGPVHDALWRDLQFAAWLMSKRNGPVRQAGCVR